MRLAWLTDIHLDCVDDLSATVNSLIKQVVPADAVIVSGDISVSHSLIYHLNLLEDAFNKPVYFVLGNHDYYYSDILSVRKEVTDECLEMRFCKYLGSQPFVMLTPTTALIGSDGWYDAYNGDPRKSEFIMSDWLNISDFKSAIRTLPGSKQIDINRVMQVSREICKASVAHVARGINAVAPNVADILIVTHVPPFEQAYTNGKYKNIPNDHVTPWYTSKMMGEMLLTISKTYPEVQFTILSGHTHSEYQGNISPNLRINVGKSSYGAPQVVGYIDT